MESDYRQYTNALFYVLSQPIGEFVNKQKQHADSIAVIGSSWLKL